jgi:hypothetical protein
MTANPSRIHGSAICLRRSLCLRGHSDAERVAVLDRLRGLDRVDKVAKHLDGLASGGE